MSETFDLPPARCHAGFAFSDVHGLLQFQRPTGTDDVVGRSRLAFVEQRRELVLPIDDDHSPGAIALRGDRLALSFNDRVARPKAIVIGRLAADGRSFTPETRIARGGWDLALEENRIACTNRSRGAWVYDAHTGESAGFLHAEDFLAATSFDPGGDSLVALGTAGKLFAWRVRAEKADAELVVGSAAEAMARSPDGTHLVVRTPDEIVLVRRDPFEVVWRAQPTRPRGQASAPIAGVGWLNDDTFVVPFSEGAPEGTYLFRAETFFYVFARSGPEPIARVRAPAFCHLATDPARERLVFTEDAVARIHTLRTLVSAGRD